jgi:predicted ATPase with chaperone activity
MTLSIYHWYVKWVLDRLNILQFIKLAYTIADLAESEDIHSTHLEEALQYRPKLKIE